MSDKPYDIVVFGATSFVGKILCRYLLEQFGLEGELKWAAAGRSEAKFHQLRQSIGTEAAAIPFIVADAADEESLQALCAQTRVVITTVGPYALYGEPLLKTCATTGTDYCDLTGEVQWIRRMISKYETAAQASGARIVHCCGFDSIPSDLGVLFVQQAAEAQLGQPCTHIKMRVRALRGGYSGGTAASLLNVAKEASANPALLKELANPYSLCPPNHPFTMRQDNNILAHYDADFKSWVAPFVMAAINTRIVHRSNALLGVAYGRNFRYDEAMLTGRGLSGGVTAAGIAVGLGSFMAATALPPIRWGLERFVMPSPGEGPSRQVRQKGRFDIRFMGQTAAGQKIRAKVAGDRDPGYGSTAKMLGQAGACLVLDISKEEKPGGFWTTATIFGERLIKRLCEHAGLTFELLE